ncbi:MAG: FkbM family methyltransferase, partial [Rhodanobacteraceae bacterium]
LMELLRPGQVFFDVGANVGVYTLLGAKTVGPTGAVVAFEPLPRNLAFLFRHLRLNRARNVTIAPLACADRVATELFYEGANPALGRLATVEQAGRRSGATLVATVTLDAAAEHLRLQPDVLKIDVEGAELRVLEGAKTLLEQARPAILLSIHSDQLRQSCLSFLENHNYTVTPLDAETLGQANEYLATPRPAQNN